MTDHTLLRLQADAIIQAAIASPYGIVVQTSDALRAKQVLYRFRKELGNPEYMNLQIRFSPHDPKTQLWLIRRETEQKEDEGEIAPEVEPKPKSESSPKPALGPYMLELD